MKQDLVDIKNNKSEKVELLDRVFAAEVNNKTIYESIKNLLANKRQGTAATKNRALVAGTTRKPWKQKGTGRARSGSNKSPLWRGGAVIFGPQPRDYSYSIPKKVKNNAFFSVMSQFVNDKKLIVLDDFSLNQFKTKDMFDIFSKISDKKKVLFIFNSENVENYIRIRKSCANIPWLKVVNALSIEIKDLYYSNQIVVSKSSLEIINKTYGEKK